MDQPTMAQVLQARSQWERLRDTHNRTLANQQGAPGLPGMPGSQSGADPLPFSQVPGGGSTANAVQPPNPLVEDRAYYNQLADDGFANSMLGYGTALGTMAFLPPNPATLALALGGVGLGTIGGLAQGHGERNARRLGYQGN